MRSIVILSLALVGALVGALAGSAVAGPAPAAIDPAAMIERTAPALVCLKYVYKSKGKDFPYEARGTVIDPKGLVLVSNAYMTWGEAQVGGLKVMFGNEAKEWESVLVAKDTVRGLAFVQVLGLGDTAIAAVDVSKDAPVRVGDDLVSFWRDSRGYDFVPG